MKCPQCGIPIKPVFQTPIGQVDLSESTADYGKLEEIIMAEASFQLETFVTAAIEINAQLSRFVYRGQLSNEEAATKSVAQARALVEALKSSKDSKGGLRNHDAHSGSR